MRTVCTLLVSMTMALGAASAREPPAAAAPTRAAPASPSPQELQPAVDTTPTAPSEAPPDAAAAPPPPPAADESARRGAIERGATSDATSAAGERRTGASSKAGGRAPKGPDRVQLDTTDITGNRELPKVLYIVPWRHSDLGDLTGKPPKSLLDEVLEPVDRDVFLRENRYYDALKPGASSGKPGTAPGSDGKP